MNFAERFSPIRSGKPSWLRQAGVLFLLVLSPLEVFGMNGSGIDVRQRAVLQRINGQDEPRTARLGAPHILIPDAAIYERSPARDMDSSHPAFPPPWRDCVAPWVLAFGDSQCALRADLSGHRGMNVIAQNESWGFPVVLEIHVEEPLGLVREVATGAQIGAINVAPMTKLCPAGSFGAANGRPCRGPQSFSGTPQGESEHGNEYRGNGRENPFVVVKELAFAVDDGERLPSGETPNEFWARIIGFSCWFGFLLFCCARFVGALMELAQGAPRIWPAAHRQRHISSHAFSLPLASPDRFREIVVVLAIVVPDAKFCNRNIAWEHR
jgi:hypothetical protein